MVVKNKGTQKTVPEKPTKEKKGKATKKAEKSKEKPKIELVPAKPKKIPPPPACFSPDDLQRFKDVYKLHDYDNVDLVSIKEIPIMLRRLGFNPKPEEVREMCKTFLEDEYADTLQLHEWYFMVEMKMAMPDDFEPAVTEAMAILGEDIDDTGAIDFETLRQGLTAWGEPLQEIEFVDWVKLAKKDKTLNEDGSFFYKTFIENMNMKDNKFFEEPVNYFKLDQATLAALAKEKIEKEEQERQRIAALAMAKEEAKRKRMIEQGLLLEENVLNSRNNINQDATGYKI